MNASEVYKNQYFRRCPEHVDSNLNCEHEECWVPKMVKKVKNKTLKSSGFPVECFRLSLCFRRTDPFPFRPWANLWLVGRSKLAGIRTTITTCLKNFAFVLCFSEFHGGNFVSLASVQSFYMKLWTLLLSKFNVFYSCIISFTQRVVKEYACNGHFNFEVMWGWFVQQAERNYSWIIFGWCSVILSFLSCNTNIITSAVTFWCATSIQFCEGFISPKIFNRRLPSIWKLKR